MYLVDGRQTVHVHRADHGPLAAADHQVGDLLAGRRPLRHGAGGAVLEIVRVGGDGQPARPVLRDRLESGFGHV